MRIICRCRTRIRCSTLQHAQWCRVVHLLALDGVRKVQLVLRIASDGGLISPRLHFFRNTEIPEDGFYTLKLVMSEFRGVVENLK